MTLSTQRPCKTATLSTYRKGCTSYYGCPKEADGRPDGVAIQGIVIHYLGVNQDQYSDMTDYGPMPPVNMDHTSVHYSISPTGTIINHVDPDNLAWAHTTCASNFPVPLTPPYSYPGWPVLSAANPSYPLDYYTIHIGITQNGIHASSGRCDGDNCDGWSYGLREGGQQALIKLVAELSNTYSIPIDSEHIQFHEYIEDVPGEEIPCLNGCFVCEVAAYCEDCENYRDTRYQNQYDVADMHALYGETLEGCLGKMCLDDLVVPWDGSSPLGTLNIVDDGAGSSALGHNPNIDVRLSGCTGQLMNITPDGLCTTVSSTGGITGNGTGADPLRIDLCGLSVPAGTIGDYVGVDAGGCLVRGPLPAETIFSATNTDGAVSVNPGGTSGHSPTFNINVANGADCPGNLIGHSASGLCANISTSAPIIGNGTSGAPLGLDLCAFDPIVPPGTPLAYLGIDNTGCVVKGVIPPAPETTWIGNGGGIVNVTNGGTNGHGPTISATVENGTGIQGDGTSGNPIILDRCDILALAPDEEPRHVLGLGVDDCLVRHGSNAFVRERIDALDTDCINLTWDVGAGIMTADPIIAPSFPGLPGGCNGLECTPQGLAVAPEKEHVCADSPFVFFFSPERAFAEGETDPASLAETFLDVTNDSPCYDLILRVFLLGFIEMSAGESELVTQFAGEGLYEWTQDGGTTWTPYSIIHTHAHTESLSTTGNHLSVNGVANDSKTECVVVPPNGNVRLGIRGGYTVWRGHSSAAISQVARISVSGGHA